MSLRSRRDPAKEAVAERPRRLQGEALLTVEEVARLLRVPVSWVYDHTRRGCLDPLPSRKLGKYLRFLASDIFEYVSAIPTRTERRR